MNAGVHNIHDYDTATLMRVAEGVFAAPCALEVRRAVGLPGELRIFLSVYRRTFVRTMFADDARPVVSWFHDVCMGVLDELTRPEGGA